MTTERDIASQRVPQIPDALIGEIHDGNCVAFVGAGFSASVIPPWGKLLNDLAARSSAAADVAKHVGRLVQKGSAHAFDEAAQVLPAFDRGDDDGALYGILFRGCLSE